MWPPVLCRRVQQRLLGPGIEGAHTRAGRRAAECRSHRSLPLGRRRPDDPWLHASAYAAPTNDSPTRGRDLRLRLWLRGRLSFIMKNGPGEIALWLPKRFGHPYLVLGQVRAASGARYEGDGVTVMRSGAALIHSIDRSTTTNGACLVHSTGKTDHRSRANNGGCRCALAPRLRFW